MTQTNAILPHVALFFFATPLSWICLDRVFAADRAEEFVPWREVRRINAHEHHVESVRFSPDGKRLASTSSWGSSLSISNVESGQRLRTRRFDDASVVLSPNWDTIVHVDRTEQKVVGVREFSSEKVLSILKLEDPRVLTFSPTGELLSCGLGDGRITLWRVHDGTLLWTLDGHRRYVSSLAFSTAGKLLASGGPDGAVRIWSVGDGGALRALPIDSAVLSLAFSRDGQFLAAGGNGRLKLWQTSDWTVVHDRWYGIGFGDLAFSRDARLLAVCSNTDLRPWPSLRLLRVADLEPIQVLVHEMAEADCIDFSRDGKILAAGCSDGTIRLFSRTEP